MDRRESKRLKSRRSRSKPEPQADTIKKEITPQSRRSVSNISTKFICEQILNTLKADEHYEYANIFYMPVDVKMDNVPDYYDKIKRAIDLQEIRGKNSRNEYICISEFIDDIRQMIANAYLYNFEDTSIIEKVKTFHRLFENQLMDVPSEVFKDVSKNAVEFRNKINRLGMPSEGDDTQWGIWIAQVNEEIQRAKKNQRCRSYRPKRSSEIAELLVAVSTALEQTNTLAVTSIAGSSSFSGKLKKTNNSPTLLSTTDTLVPRKRVGNVFESDVLSTDSTSDDGKENKPIEETRQDIKSKATPLALNNAHKRKFADSILVLTQEPNTSYPIDCISNMNENSAKRQRTSDNFITVRMTQTAKNQLRQDIQNLPNECLTDIARFLTDIEPSLLDTNEAEVNLNELSSSMFICLRNFVNVLMRKYAYDSGSS